MEDIAVDLAALSVSTFYYQTSIGIILDIS